MTRRQERPGGPDLAGADAIIETAVARGEIPGAVLRVEVDGRLVGERAFGRRSVAGDERVAPDDLFAVASLTKPIVAAGLLRLQEAGRVGLDDPIERYLPEFAEPRVLLAYDLETGAIESRPARGPVTIRHLLTHTAGLHHGFPSSDPVMGTLYERSGVVYDSRLLLEEKIRRLGPLPLAHDPGAAWTYGLSSDVAGRVIEVVSGVPLDRWLARFIFQPLGMDSTCFFVPRGEHYRVIAKHVRTAGRIGLMPPDPHERDGARYLSGGGGLYTTVADYARFVTMLLDGGAPILSASSVRAMTSNQIGDLTAFGLKYGLSLGLATPEARGVSPLPVGGFGWYGIFGTWFWAIPEGRIAVLFFTSVLDSAMNLPLFSAIMDAVAPD